MVPGQGDPDFFLRTVHLRVGVHICCADTLVCMQVSVVMEERNGHVGAQTSTDCDRD